MGMRDGFWFRLGFGRHPKRTLRRALALAAVSGWFFGFVLRPVRVAGESMAPTVKNESLRFALLLRYRFGEPRRGDIVVIRMAGRRVMYLKRVLAVGGDRVAFESGILRVNGEPRPEPYVVFEGNWAVPELELAGNEFFVAGDNRREPLARHAAGVVTRDRIAGGLLY